MRIKAVVFDFDGVCIDTETARYLSWKDIYASYGFELPLDEWVKNIGSATWKSDPFPILEKLTGRSLDREELQEKHKETEVTLANNMPLQPGLLERLEEAASSGIRCAIASSSSHRWVDGHLRYRKIDHYFHTTVCREDTDRHKPDPIPYMTAIERLGVPAEYAVAVEDSPPGIASAHAAGLYTIAVPGPMTASMNFSAADCKISSLTDISWETLTCRK